MSTRLATADDHHDRIGWLRADQPGGLRVVVEECDGQLVGAALRVPNPIHPTLDLVELGLVGAASAELLHAARVLGGNDVLVRAVPGSPEHELATSAGATLLDRVPPARIDPTDPGVRAWAEAHAAPAGSVLTGEQVDTERLVDWWVGIYRASHQHFGTTDDERLLRDRLRGFVEKLVDRELTRVVAHDGEPVAVAFAFHEEPALMGLVNALDAEAPGAREHVAAAMAALLQAAPEPFECDGHASGAHYPAVLAGIPHVTAGPLTPLDLLRLS